MAEKEKEEKKEEGGDKKKNNMILFIVIGVLVLLLIIIGVVVMMMMGGEEQQPPPAPAASGTDAAKGAEAKPKTKVKSDLMTVGPLFPMDQVIVNLLSQSGRRYLKTSISFELSDPKVEPEITGKKPVVRDIVISVLSSKTLEEISTSKGKDKLKDEVITKVNEILVDGQIKNIFFTDFVIQ